MDTNTRQQFEPSVDLLQEPPPEYNLYSINQMVAATVFGGPLVAAYMVAKNFKRMGLGQHAWKSWVIQISVFILTSIPDFMEGGFSIPTIFYSAFYAFCAYLMAKNLQGNLIKNHELNGGQFWGTGRVVLVVVLSLIIWLLLIFAVFMLSDWEGFQEIFKNR